MPKNDLIVGDRVVYFKGAKGPLIGHAGVIEQIRITDPEREYREAMVRFDSLGTYPCWMCNLEKEVT